MKRRSFIKIALVLLTLLSVTSLCFLFVRVFNKICIEIPVVFNDGKIPCFNAQIEGKDYLLKLDLGAYGISMAKDHLESLQKQEYDVRKTEDVFGNLYESKTYLVPKLNINELEWSNVRVGEEKEGFSENTTIYSNGEPDSLKQSMTGSLGRYLLRKINFLFDFPNNKMIACNSISTLKKKNYDVRSWLKVPFIETELGIIIEVETDFGIKKLVFDTGATPIVLKFIEEEKEHWQEGSKGLMIYFPSKFMIANHNFVDRTFYRLNFSKTYDAVDGFLGMNFIEDFQFYIDYPNRLIYINTNTSSDV